MHESAAERNRAAPGGTVSPQIIEGVFYLARDGMTGPLGEMLDAGVPINLVNPASEAEAA